MKNPKVSVISPVYNEEKYIGKLLSSLSNQTFKDFEVILGDKSTDNTREVVKEYIEKLNVRVEEPPKLGISLQKNYAASKANGEILLFIDADTIIVPHAIERVVDVLKEKDFGGARAKPISKKAFDHLALFVWHTYAFTRSLLNMPVGSGAFLFVKRKAFEQMGGFNEELTFQEDFDIVERLNKAGFSYVYLKEHLFSFSVRRFDDLGRLRFALQMTWDGIVSFLPVSIRRKLTIGYPTTGHTYKD